MENSICGPIDLPSYQDLARELVQADDDLRLVEQLRQRAADAGIPWPTVSAAAEGLRIDALDAAPSEIEP